VQGKACAAPSPQVMVPAGRAKRQQQHLTICAGVRATTEQQRTCLLRSFLRQPLQIVCLMLLSDVMVAASVCCQSHLTCKQWCQPCSTQCIEVARKHAQQRRLREGCACMVAQHHLADHHRLREAYLQQQGSLTSALWGDVRGLWHQHSAGSLDSVRAASALLQLATCTWLGDIQATICQPQGHT
jgi:hypothetical protein